MATDTAIAIETLRRLLHKQTKLEESQIADNNRRIADLQESNRRRQKNIEEYKQRLAEIEKQGA